jgi:hypothetical protein
MLQCHAAHPVIEALFNEAGLVPELRQPVMKFRDLMSFQHEQPITLAKS